MIRNILFVSFILVSLFNLISCQTCPATSRYGYDASYSRTYGGGTDGNGFFSYTFAILSAPFQVTGGIQRLAQLGGLVQLASTLVQGFTVVPGASYGNYRLGLYQQIPSPPGQTTKTYTRLAQSPLLHFPADAFDTELNTDYDILAHCDSFNQIVLTPGVQYFVGFAQDGRVKFRTYTQTNLPNTGEFNANSGIFSSTDGYQMPVTYTEQYTTKPFALEFRTCMGGIAGDPVFQGFHGQVYQVHGIPNRHFNLLTSQFTLVNGKFIFLDNGDSMSEGEMALTRVRAQAQAQQQIKDTTNNRLMKEIKRAKLAHQGWTLPQTTAWSHEGTFIGLLAMRFRATQDGNIDNVLVNAGRYGSGFEAIEINGVKLINNEANKDLVFPRVLIDNSEVSVLQHSWHTITVSTRELSFTIVNSDKFLNIEDATLTELAASNPAILDGILGQSADPERYFPHYEPTKDASGDVKSDWQQHQIFDYLLGDENPFSQDFVLNKF